MKLNDYLRIDCELTRSQRGVKIFIIAGIVLKDSLQSDTLMLFCILTAIVLIYCVSKA